MWQIYSVFLIIYGAVYADTTSLKSNQYMDNILSIILPNEARFSNVDPAELGSFSTLSKDSLAFFDVNVKFKYSNGIMTGLLKGERAGDCSPLRKERRNTTVSCTLAFDDIKIQYHGTVKYGKLPSKSITGHAKLAATYVVVDVTASSEKSPYLKSIRFTQVGDISARFTGVGFLNNQLRELAEKEFVKNVRNQFLNVFNLNWFSAMSRAVSRVALPEP